MNTSWLLPRIFIPLLIIIIGMGVLFGGSPEYIGTCTASPGIIQLSGKNILGWERTISAYELYCNVTGPIRINHTYLAINDNWDWVDTTRFKENHPYDTYLELGTHEDYYALREGNDTVALMCVLCCGCV